MILEINLVRDLLSAFTLFETLGLVVQTLLSGADTYMPRDLDQPD